MTEREVLDVLTQTRDLLADSRRWTKGTEVRDADGNDLVERSRYSEYVSAGEMWVKVARSDQAASWCVGGALDRFAGELIQHNDPRFKVLWDRIDDTVGQWNDRVTHEEMLRGLDEAIGVQRRVVEEVAR